jgi:hypothetical protein
MATDSYSLLDLILKLLHDDKEAEEFYANPGKYLEERGIEGACVEDVDKVLPIVLDYAPVKFNGSFDRNYDTGNRGDADGGHSGRGPDHAPSRRNDEHDGHDGGHDGHDGDERDAVIKEITNILNNYSYTAVNDQDTIYDQSVNQQIYNKGLLFQEFDNDLNVASGDGAIAGNGNDGNVTGDRNALVNGDNSGAILTGDGSFAGDDNNVGDGNVEGDNNATGDYSVAGRDNEVGNTDIDVDDSFNTDKSVEDSYNTDNSVEVEDSFNKEVEVEDSFNKEVDIEESFNKEKTEVDVEVEFEEEGPGDNVPIGV